MNVLLLAPRTNLLLVEAEVQGVLRSGLRVTPLLEPVTLADLLREVGHPPGASRWDVLWLATHGTPDGVLLSDGLMSASELAGLVRGCFRLIVLNTCSSIQVAQMLQNETEAEVIATIIDVPDREAYQTGVLLARALADTGQSELAYRRARPGGNRTYVRLAGSGISLPRKAGFVMNDDAIARLANKMDELTRAISDLKTEIAVLDTRLKNIERFSSPGSLRFSEGQIWVILFLLGLIAVGMGAGLYMLANGG